MNTSLGKIKTRLFLSVHGQSWECSDGDIIGREGTVALEVFRGAGVLSRRHLAVRLLNDEWFVELCPTARNLTWINEEEMLPGQLYPLGLQSVITVEEVQFSLLVQQADKYLGENVASSWAPPSVRSFGFSEDVFPHFHPAEVDPKSNPKLTGDTHGILNEMPGCVMVFDAEGYCIWSNATAAGMLGADEPPATITSFCLSFHREDEMFLKDCLGKLEESIPRNATGLRVVDASSGSVVGRLSLWMLRRGGQTIISAEAEPDAEQALIGLRLLSATYLCPEFHDSDVTVRFETIARSGLKILRCDEVSIWLIDTKDSLAKRATTVAIDDRSIEQGNKLQPGFCPLYFNRLLEDPHAAFESAESSVMPVLKGLGFTGRATGAILSVPLFQGGGLRGIVAFEWDQWKGKLSEDARLSALLVASLCLSAAASTSHHAALKQLRMREVQMAKELADAEHYVRQILPPPLDGEIDVRWMLKPSAQLGGDAFGYYWIDEDRFAIYLLDVVGHGTGAALLSISAMNSVRFCQASISATRQRYWLVSIGPFRWKRRTT
ncbi:MAG: hypothetical protein O3C21_02875 [Verrucomicrobia bacterium]|nr:hypothetical protein [Verrucomicrobiota bacterium]